MQASGGCGRSSIHYANEGSVLDGVRTSDMQDVPRYGTVTIHRNYDPRCEHGVKLSRDCPTCDFMFGLEAKT